MAKLTHDEKDAVLAIQNAIIDLNGALCAAASLGMKVEVNEFEINEAALGASYLQYGASCYVDVTRATS